MTQDITLTEQLERNPDLVSTDMDGETVMMSIQRGEYFGLGGAGSRIWDLLATPTTAAQICTLICAEFAVDVSTCQADTLAFLRDLLAADVIRRR